VFLHANDALKPFLDYYRLMGIDYRFIYGRAPRGAGVPFFTFLTVLPGVLFFLTAWRFYISLRDSTKFSGLDWAMNGHAVFILLYYQKYLSLADCHILQVHAASLPLIYYWLHRLCCVGRVKTFGMPAITVALTLAVSLAGPFSIQFKKGLPLSSKFEVDLNGSVEIPGAGFVIASKREKKIIDDFAEFFSTILKPQDAVFDFSDQPLLFHFLLGQIPAVRFHEMITVVSPAGQHGLIEELEKHPPKVVIFSSNHGFNISGVVPRSVRYHEVAEYLLDRYRPYTILNGYIILARTGTLPETGNSPWTRPEHTHTGADEHALSYRNANECNWGYVLRQWSEVTAFNDAAPEISFESKIGASPRGTTLEIKRAKDRRERYLEIDFAYATSDEFILSGSKIDDSENLIRFKTVPGFDRRYRIPLRNCLAWHGHDKNLVYLKHRSMHAIRSIRWVSKPEAIT
jgi:hypothetical protein